jgi:hypothetical protein
MQASVDFVGENNVDVGVGVSDGAIRVVILMVYDFIIASDFGAFGVFGGLSNILIKVMFYSYNVHLASTDQ